jgi:hypothetical protein
MKNVTPQRRQQGSPLVAGIILILLGGLLLALNLGFGLPLSVREYWPFLLIVPGLVGILAPSRHLSRSGAIWLLASGVYWEISMTELFGLGWFSAWPIFVIAYGLDVIFGSRRNRAVDDRVTHEG